MSTTLARSASARYVSRRARSPALLLPHAQSHLRCPASRSPDGGGQRNSLHTTSPRSSRYRGYSMHGTLREWALRMIGKEFSANKRRGSVTPHADTEYLMREADAMVEGVLYRKERKHWMPRGKKGAYVQVGDRLAREAGRVEDADIDMEGLKIAKLREALALYRRAAQRGDGSMPVLASHMWGTSLELTRRLQKTADKLERAETKAAQAKPYEVEETDWGLKKASKTSTGEDVSHTLQVPVSVQTRPLRTAKKHGGIQYKTKSLAPLPALAPSAVARSRMPLLSAFPGIGGLPDGTVLSPAHGVFTARGLLGTPSHAGSSYSNDTLHLPSPAQRARYAPDEVAQPQLRPPPFANQGKALRWFKMRKKRTRMMYRYYPAPRIPPPFPVS